MPSRPEYPSSAPEQFVDDKRVEFLRQGLRLLVQLFIELEISDQIEAAPHERNQSRRSYRNGYRRRAWMTRVGEIPIDIPKLRKGTYYPAFFDALRASESFLLDTLHKTYDSGVDAENIKRVVERVGLSTAGFAHIADTVEQLYDLVDRYRDKPRTRRPSNIISYRPVNAIATVLVDVRMAHDDKLPQSLLSWQPESWLSESLGVLIRVRQALSDQTDAIAA